MRNTTVGARSIRKEVIEVAKPKNDEPAKTRILGKATKNAGMEMTGYKYCVDGKHPYNYDPVNQNLGASRWMYNHYVDAYKADLEHGAKPVIMTPGAYKKLPECPEWLKDMDSSNLANVQINFAASVNRFLKGQAGFPKFKSKHDHHDSYTTNMTNNNIKLTVTDNGEAFLKLPKIDEPLKLVYHRPLPENATIKSVTVSREPDGRYYVSILVATPQKTAVRKADTTKAVGLDMSLPKLYIDSDGNSADFDKPYRKNEERLAKEQRRLSKMTKGSKNYEKQRLRIAKLHAKIKHQRKDTLHMISCKLTDEFDVIGIEDLDMSAMKQSLKFGKSVSDNGWGMFVKMLEYKAQRKGKTLIKVDKWFPSSKTCSCCGYIHKELQLDDREYVCPNCGHAMDRDYQAAINILHEALRIFDAMMASAA